MRRHRLHGNVVFGAWITAILGMVLVFGGLSRDAYASAGSKRDYGATLQANARVLCANAVSKDSSEDEIKQALEACLAKSAKEGLAIAKEVDYPVTFLDSANVNVTDAVKDGNEVPELGGAKITKVDVSGGFLIFGPSVTFTLDYTDPEAKAKRDAEEAEQAKVKAAADRLRGCEGSTADEALSLAKEAKHSYTFKDSAGVDVTKAVENSSSGAEVHGAKVTKVSASGGLLIFGPSVTFTLDYTDPEAKAKRDAEEAERRAKLPKVAFRRIKHDYLAKKAGKRGKKYALVGKMRGKLVNKSDKRVYKSDLPSLTVDGEACDLTLIDKDGDEVSCLPANGSCEFCYSFKEVYKEKLPEHTFSVEQSDDVVSSGLNKKAAKSFGNEFESEMDNMPEKIEAIKEEERQREEEKQRQEEEARRREEEERAQAEAERERKRAEAEEARLERLCLITETGHCYHSSNACPSLSRSKDYPVVTVREAQNMGLGPCSKCYRYGY